MTKLRIIVDIDDVLMPWSVTVHRKAVSAGINNGREYKSWNMHDDYGITREVFWEFVSGLYFDGMLVNTPPYPGVQWQLQRLIDAGHFVHLATARGFGAHSSLERGDTNHWLAKHEVPHHSLTFTKDKSILRGDRAIDDGLHNYEDMELAGIESYLINRPQNLVNGCTRRRVSTVEQFVDGVLAA